jgi:serine/threonine-protein kinase
MLDGVVVTEAAWGVSTPLDLGEHNVEASAPGKRKFSHTITLRERQRIAVEIAPLDDAVSSPPTAMSSAVRPTPAASVERPVSPTTKPESRSTLRRPLGYVIGATGIVALGVGTFFGIRAISTNASSKDHCVDGCDADGARLSREALSQARIADVAVGLGLIGVGVGTYLMLTSGAGRDERNAGSPRSRTLAIRPYAHATGGGLLMDALW